MAGESWRSRTSKLARPELALVTAACDLSRAVTYHVRGHGAFHVGRGSIPPGRCRARRGLGVSGFLFDFIAVDVKDRNLFCCRGMKGALQS